MNRIKKILACVDFSQYSLMTLEYAVELAKGSQAQIIVFNVINQIDTSGVAMVGGYFPGYFPDGTDSEDYVKKLEEERLGKIKGIIKENFFNEKSMMTIKIDRGIPFECILQAVEAEEIDLVVIANKGRGNISRVLFGSTAEKVFRHSPVPVASVRDKMKFKRM
ncbi:MAG: universal stress protein [Desulfobacula sp.]|uniref:universal stress protein n=1 Tax=Desulfobacula sp. TaxID=2593537 RepID=UPI0025C44830|nr:universal stress protein [Desulfobacula sp.]MCD4721979.1 universal stress protein [Desulfobacula sp.]